MMIKRRMPSLLTASLLLAFTSFTAHADDDEHEGRARIPLLPKYQQECSACHVAYPPGMLPAALTMIPSGDESSFNNPISSP